MTTQPPAGNARLEPSGSGSLPRPDLSERPHRVVVERQMAASAQQIYRAWTVEFDSWFASPGMIRMRPAEGEPFFFVTEHEGRRHPHYGRFLTLRPDRLIELTWVTGQPGTCGAETVVTVELEPDDNGTRLRLTHQGFYAQAEAKEHGTAWDEVVLAHLDTQLSTPT